uniref:PH domain-containing protein n=1 Tax=Moniliophthora roreri TaxID=221103 RepID=A0A0W0FY16_MONRR
MTTVASSITDGAIAANSPTSTIAATPLSTYETCAALYLRLRSLRVYSALQDLYDDPVACIRNLFLSGTPLTFIYNLLPPHYPRINLDIEVLSHDDHSKRLAVALFALHVNQFLRCEMFTYEELSHEEGLHKAVDAVHLILDKVYDSGLPLVEPDHENTPVPLSPYLSNFAKSSMSAEDKWMDCVRQMIVCEHKYLNKIELLKQYTRTLVERQVLSEELAERVFTKKTFTFMRKHLTQMDCIAEQPWLEQRWDRFFKKTKIDLGITYRIYCVNRILASETLDNIKLDNVKVPGYAVSRESFIALLDAPLDHLSEYSANLKALISVSAEVYHPYHEELLASRDTLNFKGVFVAVREAKTGLVCRRLEGLISNWNDMSVHTLGLFVREEELLVRKHDVFQRLNVFLFDNILFYCDEELPEPLVTSRKGKRKLSSASARSEISETSSATSLHIKGHIICSNIQHIERSEMERNGSQYYALTIIDGSEGICLVCQAEDQMQSWLSALENCRQTYVPGTLASLPDHGQPKSPDATASVGGAGLVKVHIHGNSFMFNASSLGKYQDLAENIARKMRRLGGTLLDDRRPIVKVLAPDRTFVTITPASNLPELFSQGSTVHLYVELEPDH